MRALVSLRRHRRYLLVVPLAVLAATPPASADDPHPMLHERIASDPRDDGAHGVSLEGELNPTIRTPRGTVTAPDPARPLGSGEAPYASKGDAPGSTFHPDNDTRRPDTLPYDEPFSPSTAPFKRLSAFDSVDAHYTLSVADPHTTQLVVSPSPPPDALSEHFFADMVIDLAAGRKVRIPSVGPGTRILAARAGVGTQDVPITLHKDGAENWFVEGQTNTRARLVMELSIPRAAFGGEFGHPTRAELPRVAPLPPNVQSAAAQVAKKIGVTPRSAPHDVVTKLVAYFRAFRESSLPPTGHDDVYLDLALEQKGVCRHRSFAFLVTALYLGIPTRMVSNEAHAWVEIDDGHTWRRIDLGGAGRMFHDPLSTNVPHDPPPDPFAWPQGSTRGQELADHARRSGTNGTNGSPGNGAATGANGTATGANGTVSTTSSAGTVGAPANSGGRETTGTTSNGGTPSPTDNMSVAHDGRPASAMTMTLTTAETRRGSALPVHGSVASDGTPCAHVAVEIVLRSKAHGDLPIGVIATDEHGNYDGSLVLPATIPLGDYEAHARTVGDSRCGRGQTK